MMTRNTAWNINYTTSWCLVLMQSKREAVTTLQINQTLMRASNSSSGRSTAGKQNWHYTM